MSAVYEESGAQVLPEAHDERATVSGYAAHLAADADVRTKAPVYAALAERLVVR